MSRIRIEDLPRDKTISPEDMRRVMGGVIFGGWSTLEGRDLASSTRSYSYFQPRLSRMSSVMSNAQAAAHGTLMKAINNMK